MGLEDFRKALELYPVLPCIKAIQAAISLGAEEVKIRHFRDGVSVSWRGDGQKLSQELLELPGQARLTSRPGLPRHLSWAMWGSIADGAQAVSWRMNSPVGPDGLGGAPWVLSFSPRQGWVTPPATFVEPGVTAIVWRIQYPWSWSWSSLSAYLAKNQAMQDLHRFFAFAPVPVKLDNRTLNRAEVWDLMPHFKDREVLADAYTLLTEDPVRLALSPPAVSEPHRVWMPSGTALSNAMARHGTAQRCGFYCFDLEDRAFSIDSESGEDVIPLLVNSETRRQCLHASRLLLTSLWGARLSKPDMPSMRYRLMGVKLHAFFDPELPEGGGLFLVQDGLLHQPVPLPIPGLCVLLAWTGHPTDATGLAPADGPALVSILGWVQARLQNWHTWWRQQSFWDEGLESRWSLILTQLSQLA